MFPKIINNIKLNAIRNFTSYTKNNLIKINVETSDNKYFQVFGEYNDSLLDIIKKMNSPNSNKLKDCLDCSCDGSMECDDCHVHLDEDSFKIINKPCKLEQNILNSSYQNMEFSKLGCQFKLKPFHNDINIKIPFKKKIFY